MGIYLTGTEFRKLWRQFDTSGDGKINYAEFNNKVVYMIPLCCWLRDETT
jgi:Ca2+-binding EF-hand superfamily protein